MSDITKQIADALIEAGFAKEDGTPNLYAAQQAGICESGKLSRILTGKHSPSIETVQGILDRIDHELTVRKKSR